jgi:hypothetical protein
MKVLQKLYSGNKTGFRPILMRVLIEIFEKVFQKQKESY